jgi:hypothetical protein
LYWVIRYIEHFKACYINLNGFCNFTSLKLNFMSLFNTNKNKDKKKGNQTTGKQSPIPAKGKSNSKGAAKATRVTGRAQRGS